MNKLIELIPVFILLAGVSFFAVYFTNIYLLTNCDFQSDYRCEVIHGAGAIIPPAAFITVFFDTDE